MFPSASTPGSTTAGRALPTRDRRRRGERGQVVVIFAGAMLALVGMCAVVVDVAWYWTSNLQMQRAADAAALAGVVWLPGNPAKANTVAIAEAAKNGFVDGVGGVDVIPQQDQDNPRRLKVRIEGSVGTFFARAIGISSWPAARAAKADYVLPVPMGSPDNYYGVGYWVKPETTTVTTQVPGSEDSGARRPTDWPQDEDWVASSGTLVDAVAADDSAYASTNTNGAEQRWSRFNLLANLDANETVTGITGIRVTLGDVRLSANCSSTTNRVVVQLSWDGGAHWTDSTTSTRTPSFSSTTQNDYQIGSTTSTSTWTASGLDWDNASASKLANGNFMVRLTAAKGCTTSGTQIRVDEVIVQVWYDVNRETTTTTTTLVQNATVPPPNDPVSGAPLAAITRPQRVWGAMQSKGAPSIQGDIFMTHYDSRTLTTNPYYDPDAYYQYAVEIPAGGGGAVWVFDPGFCDASANAGTGEYYTTGGANGSSSINPVSSYFELRNLGTDLLNPADDAFVSSFGTDYQGMDYQDKPARGAAGAGTDAGTADCSGESWHYGWVLLASGLSAGTYAIHTYSTSAGDPDNQNQQTGLNAFAFYASSASGSPRIYGIGAMEAYVRLPGGQQSEFYFAQIDRAHAGKTMEINLWDPGDTGSLRADLEILYPTGNAMAPYAPASFRYKGIKVSNSSGVSADCASQSNQTGNATSVRTNTGGTSLFNGCWLRLEVQLPNTYDAPTDPVSGEDGWWKIRYTMGGNSTNFSTDLTTWQVNIRGNPVHLVLP